MSEKRTKRWKLLVTGLSLLVWVTGLSGLPDDVRTWSQEWLPAVAGFILANLNHLGNAAAVIVAVWWLYDGVRARVGQGKERLLGQESRATFPHVEPSTPTDPWQNLPVRPASAWPGRPMAARDWEITEEQVVDRLLQYHSLVPSGRSLIMRRSRAKVMIQEMVAEIPQVYYGEIFSAVLVQEWINRRIVTIESWNSLRPHIEEGYKLLRKVCEPNTLDPDHPGNPAYMRSAARDFVNGMIHDLDRAALSPPPMCTEDEDSLRDWLGYLAKLRAKLGVRDG